MKTDDDSIYVRLSYCYLKSRKLDKPLFQLELKHMKEHTIDYRSGHIATILPPEDNSCYTTPSPDISSDGENTSRTPKPPVRQSADPSRYRLSSQKPVSSDLQVPSLESPKNFSPQKEINGKRTREEVNKPEVLSIKLKPKQLNTRTDVFLQKF